MEAEARSFSFLGNEGLLRIPFFQRPYVWSKSNWKELLDALLRNKKQHFLGSLILKQQRIRTGEPKELLVIDGQQRLTTLSVLLKVLFDSFPERLKQNCRDEVRRYLFRKKQPTDREFLIKIQHSRLDCETYTEIMRAGIDESPMESNCVAESDSRIMQCYKYLAERINCRTENENESLFNWIIDSDNKMLVVIDLSEEDDEQAIFDTINSAGVRLSSADIVKNALFQRAVQIVRNMEGVTALYKDTWEKAFLADDETIQYWETPRLTGRLTRDNIEILLHSIAVIKGFYDPDLHTLSDLAKLYKEQIDKLDSEGSVRSLAKEIADYAAIYKEKVLTFSGNTRFSFSDKRLRAFHALHVLEISTFHPFLLFIFKNNIADADGLLSDIEKFVVRRLITNKETKSYNKLCLDFIQNPASVMKKASEIADHEIADGLKAVSNKNATLLLFWVELKRRGKDNKYDEKELAYNYTLEHIMPQKWEQYWHDIPEKKHSDGKVMSFEDAKVDRSKKVYWIGNMTLLSSSLNSALRNYVFEKKVNGDGRKKGIKAYASLSITRDDIVSRFDSGDKEWSEIRIEERTEKLISEIVQIW